MRSNYRFAAIRAFATYSDVGELTKEDVYYTIEERYPLTRYCLSEEIHPSTGGRHIHALFEFQRKIDTTDPSWMDVNDGSKQYHPNIQPVKRGEVNFTNIFNYCLKEDPNPYTNIEIPMSWAEILDNATNGEEYLRLVRKHKPADYCKQLKNHEYTAMRLFPTLGIDTIENYSLPSEATMSPALAWYMPSVTLSTLVMGPAGTGKTCWAKLMAPKPALFVRHLDCLQHLTQRHKSVIFDDLDYSHLPPSTQKFLVDTTDIQAIHIRYRVATIPPGIVKIFTANAYPFTKDEPHNLAIKRRLYIIDLYQ